VVLPRGNEWCSTAIALDVSDDRRKIVCLHDEHQFFDHLNPTTIIASGLCPLNATPIQKVLF